MPIWPWWPYGENANWDRKLVTPRFACIARVILCLYNVVEGGGTFMCVISVCMRPCQCVYARVWMCVCVDVPVHVWMCVHTRLYVCVCLSEQNQWKSYHCTEPQTGKGKKDHCRERNIWVLLMSSRFPISLWYFHQLWRMTWATGFIHSILSILLGSCDTASSNKSEGNSFPLLAYVTPLGLVATGL